MHIIETVLKKYGNELNTVFVFPLRVSAMLWFQKSLSITGLKTIPAENYISWDTFKEKCLILNSESLVPTSTIIRKIFADYICAKNSKDAKNGKATFSTIIPAEYAENSSVFSEWITDVLPQLDHFEKRYENNIFKFKNDCEMNDYLNLKKIYSEFLKENSLFEPSWLSSHFFSHDKKYVIIYPELIEDFSEYAVLLQSIEEISFIHCSEFKNKNTHIDIYENAALELHSTVLQIEELLLNKISADEIAISIPDIENYSAYIKREFALRGIPLEFRSGFKLGNEQSGKIFSLIYNCVQNNFAFEFIKPILLNNHIPWKDKAGAQALIQYGIKNNCAVSWKETETDSLYKNIWIESFKIDYESTEDEIYQKERAKTWFYTFYSAVNKICTTESFSELQKRYFIFQETCIETSELSEKDNAILGRCLTELQELTLLEKKFKNYMPENRFKFFVSHLEKEIYVPQNTGRSVSAFPYTIAAGTPFKYHFILNCSQKHTNIIYDKLSFLRKDKREEMGIFETDASSYFLKAYSESDNCIFSFSEQSFGGYSIINNNFEINDEKNNKKQALEKLNTLLSYDSFKDEEEAKEKKIIYKIQKDGAETEHKFKYEKNFSYLRNKYNQRCKDLSEYIAKYKFKNNSVKISQSDLKKFYECPAEWFLNNIFSVYREKYDASIFDSRDIGNLCHEVLERLYKKIKSEDKYFKAEHIDRYKSIAKKEADELTNTERNLRGALAKPFIQSMRQRIFYAIDFVLETDKEKLNGYSPEWIEQWIETENNGILYCGKIDRVSFSADKQNGVIIDYKTNIIPSYASYGDANAAEIKLTDFQIPMYIILTETKLSNNKIVPHLIEHAWFLSLAQQKINMIVNDNNTIPVARKGKEKTREEFQAVIDSFIQYAEYFAECVREENFTKTSNVTFEKCLKCELKNICRTVYSIGNPDSKHYGIKSSEKNK